MESILIIWVMCAIACAVIAGNKNRNAALWAVIGFFTGLIGLIIICALSSQPKSETQG